MLRLSLEERARQEIRLTANVRFHWLARSNSGIVGRIADDEAQSATSPRALRVFIRGCIEFPT